MEFSYRLTGTGWAEARLRDAEGSAILKASYLTDTLASLLYALGSLLTGAPDASCAWELEPGEYRWRFEREPDLQLRLRVLHFDEQNLRGVDAAGQLIFECVEDYFDMARAFTSGLRAVLDEWGPERYQAEWIEHPFPTHLLDLIEAQIGDP